MLPTLATGVVTAATACGGCIDMNLFSALPFLAWWVVLFLGWSLLLGPFVFSWNRVGSATDLRHPAKLFLWFLGFAIVGIVVLEGSLIGPFVFLVPVWLAAVFRGTRSGVPTGWRRFCLITLVLAVTIIPLSRHGRPLPGNPLPGKPLGVPPAMPSPAPSATPAPAPAAPVVAPATPTTPGT